MPAIQVNDVTKEFRLGQLTDLKQSFMHALDSLRGRPVAPKPKFKALADVTFSVERGEVLGIIGTNGAGKSTLLKLLARITTPTSGSLQVAGSVAPLIEVGAGLIGDLSGRENIYVNGAILGMPQAEIRRKFAEIVAFAELEEFIDTPIKRYSSGMALRLGFSIATSVDADILIVDEVLAVGDLAFQRKCFDRMEDMIKRQEKTVLMVSHNIRQVERLCNRVILLDHGRIVANGAPKEVCQMFFARSDAKIKLASEVEKGASQSSLVTTGDVTILEVALVDSAGQEIKALRYKSNMAIRLRFKVNKELKAPLFGLGFHTTDFLYLCTHDSEFDIDLDRLIPGEYTVLCQIKEFPLLPGVYAMRLGMTEGMAARVIFYGENIIHFQVIKPEEQQFSGSTREGFFDMNATWNLPKRVDAIVGEKNCLTS